MALLQRFTHPLLSLLPDLNNIPVRRQAVGAMIASIVLHVLLLLLLAFAASLLPAPRLDFARSKPKLQELEVTLFETPQLEIVTPRQLLQRAEERQFIDSAGLAKSEAKPEEAIFESDQDMIAASEKAGAGDAPLPAMDGRDLPFTNFTTQDVRLGPANEPPGPEAADPAPPAAPPAAPERLNPEQPVAKKEEPSRDPAKDVPPVEAPKAAPPPLPKVERISPEQIAIARPDNPAPSPETGAIPMRPLPRPVPAPVPEPPVEVARLATPPPRPQPLPRPGFQSQQERTKIDGSITNRGKAAVDAVRTPLAVYRKQVNAAIGSRWYYYVRQRRDLIAFGSVKVSYAITAAGRIVDVNIVTNTSNQTLANICQQSIREAEIGPPPEEAVASMVDGRLEGDLTFTYYDLH